MPNKEPKRKFPHFEPPIFRRDWPAYRQEVLSAATIVTKPEELTRDHPLIQLFLANKTHPDSWRFWVYNHQIWAQQLSGSMWSGPIFLLRRDGVWEIFLHDWDETANKYRLLQAEAKRKRQLKNASLR